MMVMGRVVFALVFGLFVFRQPVGSNLIGPQPRSLDELEPNMSSTLARESLEASPQTGPSSVHALTRDLLAWIAKSPRSYAETMDAWRSSCPRFTIWEDALADNLIQVERVGNLRLSDCPVVLTPRGRAALESA
jgi:hypothetical protein